jgi:sec-independent protein translocase protein TatC
LSVARQLTAARRAATGFARRGRSRTVEDSRMTLTEHLTELRNRLFVSLIALAVATAVCFAIEPHIFNVLKAPYCDLPSSHRLGGEAGGCQLYFFGILDAFMVRLKISFIAGAVVSAPIWLYQLWAFVTPGLHTHERRWAASFIGSALVLFGLGGFFAYLTLSKGLRLLLGFGGGGLTSILDVNRYLSYVIAMLLVFGISFLLPLLVTMLNLAGVVTTDRLRGWRRPEIFLVFAFAAFVTPSQDPFTMCALALPMVFLYEVAIVIGRVRDKRVARRAAKSPYADLGDDEVSPLVMDDLPAQDPTPAAPAASPGDDSDVTAGSSSYADST